MTTPTWGKDLGDFYKAMFWPDNWVRAGGLWIFPPQTTVGRRAWELRAVGHTYHGQYSNTHSPVCMPLEGKRRAEPVSKHREKPWR